MLPTPSVAELLDAGRRDYSGNGSALPLRREMPPSELLGQAIADEGFLRTYVDYARQLTDAPDEFHVSCALVTLATAAGNRVFVDAWGGRIFPNLWMVLVSPSGWYRKSTAMNISKRLLVDAGLEDSLYPPQWSRESLHEVLAAQPAGLLQYGEFSSFLAMLGRDYMSGAKEDLTELFDSPSVYARKLKNAQTKIQYPAINLLAGTVIDWLTGRVREGDVRGGFLARFLFVTATKKDRWMGLSGAIDQQKHNTLVTHLQRIRKLDGEVGRQAITGAYERWLRFHESTPPESNLTGFYSRLGTYALKLAVLLELARATPRLEISLDSWRRAEALTEYLRGTVTELVQEQVTASPFQVKRAKLLERIRRQPGISHQQLLRNVHFEARDFKSIIDTLKEEGSIRSETIPPNPHGGRSGLVYHPVERRE